jgi:DNA-binding NtrC family response regulator
LLRCERSDRTHRSWLKRYLQSLEQAYFVFTLWKMCSYSAMRRTVLSVSQHSATQITRNLILERAGYQVISSGDLSEAVRLFSDNTIHAVVLGGSLSDESRQELGSCMKRMKPQVPIVMFCKTTDSRALRELADEQVESSESPQMLLDALGRIFQRNGQT